MSVSCCSNSCHFAMHALHAAAHTYCTLDLRSDQSSAWPLAGCICLHTCLMQHATCCIKHGMMTCPHNHCFREKFQMNLTASLGSICVGWVFPPSCSTLHRAQAAVMALPDNCLYACLQPYPCWLLFQHLVWLSHKQACRPPDQILRTLQMPQQATPSCDPALVRPHAHTAQARFEIHEALMLYINKPSITHLPQADDP